ncbi:MAG: ABC transporter substrate-binding protein [Hoeflea sp.]|uniref:ABC transporter substrate-binding protein n=1 Tax=Hoeflea sp. TaxID=1940281 RepID=UPI0032971E1F
MKRLVTAVSLLAMTSLPAVADPVKIGMITTLSGPPGYLGEQIRDGFQLAVDQESGKLGGVEVEVVVEDDGLKPGNGLQIADKFMNEEGIKLITGIVFSNVAGAAVPEIVDNGAIYISPNAGPSGLAGASCNKNYFVVSWQNDALHEATGVAAKKLGYKTAVALAPNYQAGKDAIAGFKREFGGEVTELYTALDQTDFAPEMAQIRAAAPDVVFQFHPGGLGITFLKQYQQAGLLGEIPMVLSEPSLDSVILGAVGDAAIGIKGTTHWAADFDNAASKDMVAAWVAKYPDRPITTYAQQGYETARLIASAFATTGGVDDMDALQAALKAAKFDSTRGSFAFGSNQHPVQDWFLTEIVADANGKPQIKTLEKLREAAGDIYAAECKM